jgi:hypothetical protein
METIIEWQVAYYNVKSDERVTEQDHMIELEMYDGEELAQKRAEEMHQAGCFDVSLTKMKDECPISVSRFNGKEWT